MAVDKTYCFFNLALDEEQVIDQANLPQSANALIEAGMVEEAFRFGLHNVAQSDELWVCCQCSHRVLKIRSCEGRPSHDAADGVAALCELQQPLGLFESLLCLYRHCPVYTGCRKLGNEICGKEIPSECGHGI